MAPAYQTTYRYGVGRGKLHGRPSYRSATGASASPFEECEVRHGPANYRALVKDINLSGQAFWEESARRLGSAMPKLRDGWAPFEREKLLQQSYNAIGQECGVAR